LSRKWEKTKNLSRGEKVLVMLARATVADQPLLLIDEPLAGLDKNMALTVRNVLKKLSIAGHSMLILTTDGSAFQLPGVSEYSIIDGKLK